MGLPGHAAVHTRGCFNAWLDILMTLPRQRQTGHPPPSINTSLLWVENQTTKKAFFDEPTLTQAATHVVPTPAYGTSCSTECSLPQAGTRGWRDEQVPGRCLSPLQPWAGTTHPLSGHLTPFAASAFPGSWRRRCSISLPTWSSRKTSHCDTRSVSEAVLAPLVSQTAFEPSSCPPGCQPRSKPQ